MFDFSVPTKIVFGENILSQLGQLARQYGERIFLVTDAKAMQDTGYLSKVKKLLEEESYGVLLYNRVYSQSQSDSNSEIVNRGADQARHAKCNVIVGIGGKTSLQIAKAIAFLVSNGGNLEDYFLGRKGDKKKVSYIEIPTGYGFIPGLTNFFYVTDKFDSIKKVVETPKNHADLVLIDPRLSITLPGKTSSYIGVELLSLAIETFISKRMTPIAEAMAIKAIDNIATNLAKSIQDPENVLFKSHLSTASVLTSIALANSAPGICFALSMALNSVFGLYHGLSASILLPHVMEFNLTSCANRYVHVAKAFGENVNDITVVEAAIKAIEGIRKILTDLRIPISLGELNIDKGELMKVARLTRNYEFMNFLPRPVSKDDLFNILNSAY